MNCATEEQITSYFGQPRFFDKIEYMDNALEVIKELVNEEYEICIVSMGTTQNLTGKKIWLNEHLPNIEFIGCNFNQYKDKSHVDMSGGILIDDEKRYLEKNSADISICFGDEYEWNREWTGIRCHNWYDVKRYLDYSHSK